MAGFAAENEKHGNYENHENPGCKTWVPQNLGLEKPDLRALFWKTISTPYLCHSPRAWPASIWGHCTQVLVFTSIWSTRKGVWEWHFSCCFSQHLDILGPPNAAKQGKTQNDKSTLFYPPTISTPLKSGLKMGFCQCLEVGPKWVKKTHFHPLFHPKIHFLPTLKPISGHWQKPHLKPTWSANKLLWADASSKGLAIATRAAICRILRALWVRNRKEVSQRVFLGVCSEVLRSQPPFTGVLRGPGRKVPPGVLFECFWAPGSECPRERFLSAF